MRILLLLIISTTIFFSCSREGKKEFIEKTMRERHSKPGRRFMDYTILKETMRGEVKVVYVNVRMKTETVEVTVKDSIIYTVTGDHIYIAQ